VTARRGGWLAAALMLAASACAPAPAPLPAPVPGVAVRKTALARYVEIIGLKAQHAPPFLGVPGTNFFVLRSWLDRDSGRATTQLYVSDSYQGAEKKWSAAYDAAGAALPFTAIRRDQISCAGGCAWVEDFAALIPETELATAAGGLAVTFLARSGDRKTILLTPRQIRAQRAAIAATRLRLLRGIAGSPRPIMSPE
jgi:hypothetical protein